MKVQAKHGKVTQNMHGASRNYRYVWDVSLTLLHGVYPLFCAESVLPTSFLSHGEQTLDVDKDSCM